MMKMTTYVIILNFLSYQTLNIMIEYENLGKLNAPWMGELREAANGVINSGWYVLGNNVTKFESEFAAYNGSKHCIGVASGLDALLISLVANNFPAGSEVIVPSNTYIATILAIIHAGLTPILVEPNIETYNIEADRIREKISEKTKAVLIVHLYGKACSMQPILELCSQHGLILIEDCAQAHGAECKGRKTGTFGQSGAFSFYPTKNLGALGDAGAITTDDDHIADRIRKLRNYGSRIKYHNDIAGYNSRLDEIQAAFLRIKLKSLDAINKHKRKLSRIYDTELNGAIIRPVYLPDHTDVFHIYPVRTERRDDLKKFLANEGIGTEIHYPIPPHKQEAFRSSAGTNVDFSDLSYPISEKIHSTILSLPISYFHTEQDIRSVCNAVNSFFRH